MNLIYNWMICWQRIRLTFSRFQWVISNTTTLFHYDSFWKPQRIESFFTKLVLKFVIPTNALAHQSLLANLLTNLSELTGTLGRIQSFWFGWAWWGNCHFANWEGSKVISNFFKHAGETVKQLLLTALKGIVAKH